jgi:hypothetical protein
MTHEFADDDEDDDLAEEPRVRPFRLILASVFALLGTAGTLLAVGALWFGDSRSEPQGEVRVTMQPLASAVAGIMPAASTV